MPVVTIDPTASERFELKTAPADPNDPTDENGYVVLRPLPYGMKLTRRDKSTKMMMRSQTAPNKLEKVKGTPTESVMELESMNEWAVAYDFANCILDHNLTDQNKQKLNFSNPLSIKMLDPKVGSEIEKLVNSLNEDEDELMLDDFPPLSNSSSTDEQTSSMEDGSGLKETATTTP